MNPVLASGLLKIGSDLVSRAIPSPRDNLTASRSFENELKDVQVTRAEAVNLSQLQKEILDIPEIQNFISQNPDSTVTIDQLSDGSIRVLSSTGDFMTLRPESASCQKAVEFLKGSIAEGKNLSTERDGSVTLIG
jgi:hypothetical protein